MSYLKLGALQARDAQIVGLLDKLSRFRALDPDEAAQMQRAMHRLGPKRSVWRWSPGEDRAIRNLIAKRERGESAARFERADDVRRVAKRYGRTYWAVLRRMERLKAAPTKANGDGKLFKREATTAPAMMAGPCQTENAP